MPKRILRKVIRDSEKETLSLSIYSDGTSMIASSIYGNLSVSSTIQLSAMDTKKLYRVLWKHFGILEPEITKLKESS